jgi:hypothetical protein
MTIDQQLRDRFDRETSGTVPEPDLAAAIAGGRRRRRRRMASYAVGSLAVAAVAAAAVVAPSLGTDTARPDAAADAPPADDGTFVPGTTIDTDLAAAVAAADPSLPAPTRVFAGDWSRDTPLPGDQFANATEWQLVYELAPGVELLVYVSKPIPGGSSVTSCPAGGGRVVHVEDGTQTVAVPGEACVEAETASGSLVTVHDSIGDPVREFWYHSMLTAPDGRFVNVIEEVTAGDPDRAVERRVLTDDQLRTVALAGGLDFPDPVAPPPDP